MISSQLSMVLAAVGKELEDKEAKYLEDCEEAKCDEDVVEVFSVRYIQTYTQRMRHACRNT